MAIANNILPLPLSSIDAGTFTGFFMPIDPNGLPQPCFSLRIVNRSSSDIFICYGDEGKTEHSYLGAWSVLEWDFQANNSPSSCRTSLKKGIVLSVKGNVGKGYVYIGGWYNSNY